MKTNLKFIPAAFFLNVLLFSGVVSAQRPNAIPNSLKAFVPLDNSFRVIKLGPNDKVSVRWVNDVSNDDLQISKTILNAPKCLSKDELKGTKNELFIKIQNPVMYESKLTAGSIIDADVFLNTGEIMLTQMSNRMPTVLRVSNSAIRENVPVNPQKPENFETKLFEARNILKKPNNFSSNPSIQTSSESYEYTSEEALKVQLGASAFLVYS